MDAMAELRAATRSHHDEIEGAVDFMTPDVDLETYRGWISRLYSFTLAFEAELARNENVRTLDDLEERKKSHLLARDLDRLGVATASIDHAAVGSHIPRVDTKARMLGAMYVMEGSTLGGQMIVRHLAKVLPRSAREATSYFASYGSDTGRMWAHFGAHVRAVITDARELEECIDAARETFRGFGRWLQV